MKNKVPSISKKVKVSLGIVLLLLFIGALGAAGYFYKQYADIKKNPNATSQKEVNSVTADIKKFMDLPTDEQPTLATVTDKDKLKGQDFFKKAANGDKILIYTKARKAILYRPSTGRVLEFAPLLLGDNAQSPASQTQANEKQPHTTTVAIYNGTTTAGLSGTIANKLESVPNLSIIDKTNAAKSDYTKSQVIDISGAHKKEATDIARKIGGKVSSALPDGEEKPNTDILIIAGK